MACCDEFKETVDPKDKDFIEKRKKLKDKLVKVSTQEWNTLYKCKNCGQLWLQEYFVTGHYESSRYHKTSKSEILKKFPAIKI
ncbi:MAG: hypothetical protein GF384_04830 [Elusimicrobia bacterium]|nr:hypothetical protein [Elusimicrobiota bacterium]